jgi:1-phosphofructokinase family hexose kinase
MILCLTPNPAVDRTLIISKLIPGQVHRAPHAIAAAGGKGVNVARALKILGGQPKCLGFLGGHTGRLVAELAEREGLQSAWTWIEDETRMCVILVDESGGEATVLNENGPHVRAADWERLANDVHREIAAAQTIGFSGSLPPGSLQEAFAQLLHKLCAVGKSVWVDISGATLSTALSVPGVNIKVNASEAEAVLQQSIPTIGDAIQAAHTLRARGVQRVAITLGGAGAVLVTSAGEWHVAAPPIHAVSAVGSGDSFLAGLMLGLENGLSPLEALRWAVAAGAANALSAGGGQFTSDEFQAILARIT